MPTCSGYNSVPVSLHWIEFKPFEKGTSWFIYQEFIAPGWDNESKILLAEYKDWKMVWKWLVLCKDKPACIICR